MAHDDYQALHTREEHSCVPMTPSISFCASFMLLLGFSLGLRQYYMPVFQSYNHSALEPTAYSNTDNLGTMALLMVPAVGLACVSAFQIHFYFKDAKQQLDASTRDAQLNDARTIRKRNLINAAIGTPAGIVAGLLFNVATDSEHYTTPLKAAFYAGCGLATLGFLICCCSNCLQKLPSERSSDMELASTPPADPDELLGLPSGTP